MLNHLKRYLTFLFLLAFPLLLQAAVSPAHADSLSQLLNHSDAVCDSSCSYYAGEHSAMGLWNSLFTFLLVVFGAIWLYSTYKKKYILFIGGILGLAVAASYLYPELIVKNTVPANCPVVQMPKDTSNGKAFLPPTEEFEQVETTSQAVPTDEFTSAETTTDEFATAEPASDEFSSAETPITLPDKTWQDYLKDPNIYEPIVIFLIIALISLFVKKPTFRKYRGLFLLASLIYLGFYRGACPCMISSWQNSILIFLSVQVKWESLLWFLLLIPGAYLFGKIWCGWLCHLGALQEFLYKALHLKILQGNKAQKIIKYVQISVFVLWILQLILTRSNLFCEYDPFKFAFNLIAPTTTGYVLLAILLVSSVLIYRPFCRSFCPVGLMLGWVSFIPGARKLHKNETCVHCKNCDSACQQRALIHENKETTLRVQDCILCGECMRACKVKKSLNIINKK